MSEGVSVGSMLFGRTANQHARDRLMSNSRVSDNLRYMTVRILTSKEENENWTGAGTGFLYRFQKENTNVPILVTNKHVIDAAVVVGLTFHITTDGNQSPQLGAGRLLVFRLHDLPPLLHPDPNVDLAAIFLAPLMNRATNHEGWTPYVKCLAKQHLPSPQMMADLGALEEVVMVGYPTGIVDAANNFPIVRRGITSTPYSTNYQGRREFLADIPVYRGSSGSPVCLLNDGAYLQGDALVMGSRFALLGILYAGHTETVTGDIVTEPIPTNLKPVAKAEHMINLGLCIKSDRLEELAAQIPGW